MQASPHRAYGARAHPSKWVLVLFLPVVFHCYYYYVWCVPCLVPIAIGEVPLVFHIKLLDE